MMNKETRLSFKKSLFYLMIAIINVSLGRIIAGNIAKITIDYNLLLLFIISSIIIYSISYKITSPRFKEVKLKTLLIKILPLYWILEIIILIVYYFLH